MTRYRDRYEEIFELLTRSQLQQGEDGLDEWSLGPELFEDDDRWLGFYTREGLRTALHKYGFFRDLERLGFRDCRIQIRTDDPDQHLFRLHSGRPDVDEPLIELTVRRDFLRPRTGEVDRLDDRPRPMLTVDWLLMQNPTASFRADRPPLPGQHFPGLGVGAQVLEMLRNICHRLDLAGITTVPSYFHNAVFYSREFHHFDPRWQGLFEALMRDLLDRLDGSVVAASWALHWDLVEAPDSPDRPVSWFQQLMIDPISESLQSYFADSAYRDQSRQTRQDHRFEVDRHRLDDRLRARGIAPFDPDRIAEWID